MAQLRQPPSSTVTWPDLLALRWSHICLRLDRVLWPDVDRSLPASEAVVVVLAYLDEQGVGDDARVFLAGSRY